MTSNQEKPKAKHQHNGNLAHNHNQHKKQQQQAKNVGNHTPNLPSKPQVTKPTSGWAAIAAAKAENKADLKQINEITKPSASSSLKLSSSKPQVSGKQNSTQQHPHSPSPPPVQASKKKEKSKSNVQVEDQQQRSSKETASSNQDSSSIINTTPSNTNSHNQSNNNNHNNNHKSKNKSSSKNNLASDQSNHQQKQAQQQKTHSSFNRLEIVEFLSNRSETLSKKAQPFKQSGSDWTKLTSNKSKKVNNHEKDIVAFELSKYLKSRKVNK